MGLPFSIVQGLVGIIDTAGNIVETVLSAGKRRLTAQSSIVGGNLVGGNYLETDVVYGSDLRKRVCVDATFNVEQQAQYLTSKYRIFVDNTEISIPSSTTYSSLVDLSGSGFFFGLHCDTDKEKTEFRIEVDGEVVISDVSLKYIKDLGFIIGANVPTQLQARQLWNSTGADFDFSPPLPIRFNTSLKIFHRNPTENWKRQRFMYHYELFS